MLELKKYNLGTTLVIVKKKFCKSGRVIPSILIMKSISKQKVCTTPAVFPVYASLLTLQWLKNLGGVAVIEKLNNAKAALLYARLIEIHCSKELPQLKIVLMNATFL
jgi:phosphoserine aminotransferase